MKLKGLVWFFTIALILFSLFMLSYTWVIRSHENKVRAQAEKIVKNTTQGLTPDQKAAAVELKTQRILDSTKDKSIYPIFGTSYEKCKKNELNLGLDLQGGMSVTMDVSLEGLLKSLSNNSKDEQLLAAIKEANVQKLTSEENYIDLFAKAYTAKAGAGKLNILFAGPGKDVKVGDEDAAVVDKLKKTAGGAIEQTYKILQKRIDKFGVAQPSINLNKNRGVITVELAGVKDPKRVRDYLTTSANLQFWEVYKLDDPGFGQALQAADKAMQDYVLNGGDSTKKITDSTIIKANMNPLFRLMNPMQGYQDPNTGKVSYGGVIGNVALKDTPAFNAMMANPIVINALPSDVKLMYGLEEKIEKTNTAFLPVYAIKTLLGSEKAPLEGEGVEEAYQGFDDLGRPSIKMNMTSTGAKTWGRLTTKNVGRPIAIALDNIVYSAPNVNGPIEGGNSEISGTFTVEQAQDLSNVLKSGKLDAPAKIVAEQVVGPTLGKEAVKGGTWAFLLSFIVIFALMLIYYNTAGWVANIALVLNLLFTIGVLTALKFTLTAAGIAGLVLTIGMAVDTNVVIFERIKDELNRGKSYQQAVDDGYQRSLPPVLDAHITSLITAIILAVFGLGPVLGFATTQIIGILLSLFCGILVSRLITDFWTNKNRHFNYFTGLSRRIFKHANFDFVGMRKIAYIISAFVLVLGIAAFFNGFHEGVEFKGGRSYTVSFPQAMNNDMVRDELKKALDGDNVVIKTVGDNKHLNITTAYMIGVNGADEQVQTKLFEGIKQHLPANTDYATFVKNHIQSSTTIQPSISDDLKRGAVKATLFAIFAIFLYIFVRFRDWRYSLGTIFTLLHDVLVTLIIFSFFKNIVPFPLEIDQHFIAAILTVIGFSMNDTVIVFDRIREYSRDHKGMDKKEIVNRAINETLSRTIMTSLTVFLTILILFIFGGEVTRGFAFAMLIGVITGTYSTIFVGAPVLLEFSKDKPLGAASEKRAVEKAPEL